MPRRLLLACLVASMAACAPLPAAPAPSNAPVGRIAIGATPHARPCPPSANFSRLPPQVTLGRGDETAPGYEDSFTWRGCGGQAIASSDYFLPDGPRLSRNEPLTFHAPPGIVIHDLTASYWPASNGRSWVIDRTGERSLETRTGGDPNTFIVVPPPSGTWSIGVEAELDDQANGVTWSGGYTFRLTIAG